jgi:asparaginyl-tRNA synthetase
VLPFIEDKSVHVAEVDKADLSRKALRDIKSKLPLLEQHLSKCTFLVKDRFSLADIGVASSLFLAFQHVVDPETRDDFEAVTRWVETCMKQSCFVASQPNFSLCAKTPDYSALSTKVKHLPVTPLPLSKVPHDESKTLFRRPRSRVKDLLAAEPKSIIGTSVTLCGWARTVRGTAVDKGPVFVELNDGSCMSNVQIVCVPDSLGRDGVESVLEAGGIGASFQFEGTVVESPAKGQAIEVQATYVRVLGKIPDPSKYPLQKSRTGHSVEYLREIAHLRPRTNLISAVARVRHACAMATHRFFDSRGFSYIHTPIITAADCEGAGSMFQVTTLLEKGQMPLCDAKNTKVKAGEAKVGDYDYSTDFFGKAAFLTVSGQLNVECYATALSDVYTFGPTFRAENSNTTRHLAEFWMIEPEICFATLEDDMNLVEDFIKCVTREIMTICREDLEFFEERVEKGLIKRLENVLEAPFERLTYRRAINILNEHIKSGQVKFEEMDLHFGTDLGSEHERYLTETVFKKPVILTNYPAGIKAFYMKRSEEDPETVEAMDVLVPKIGELVGGSARETDFDLLESKMHAMDLENEWYMDLRKYGSVPHAGFGVGFERLIMFVTGITNIRDVIPFPRFPNNAEF